MNIFAESSPKQSQLGSQSSREMPATNELTIDDVKGWNTNKLLEWIQQQLSIPLKPKDEKKFLDADIDGEAFLGLASNRESFRSVGLSLGASQKLAQLAKKLAELVNDPIYKKCKDCRLHCTLHATTS